MYNEQITKCITCDKNSYLTYQKASEVARYRENESIGRTFRLQVYKCPHGNGWHISKRDFDE